MISKNHSVHANINSCTDIFSRESQQIAFPTPEQTASYVEQTHLRWNIPLPQVPSRVVSNIISDLGLQQGPNQRLTVGFFSLFDSKPAKYVRYFQNIWGIAIHYTNSEYKYDQRVRAVTAHRDGGVSVERLFLPISLLQNKKLLISYLDQTHKLLQHNERLKELGAQTDIIFDEIGRAHV